MRIVLSVQNLSVPKDPRVWREARTLAAAGFDVTVVCPRDADQVKQEDLEGVHVVRYGPTFSGTRSGGLVAETLLGVFAVTWKALGIRRRGRSDVFHVANPPDAYFPLGWLLKRLGAKFVFDLHDPTAEVLRAKFGEHKVLDTIARWMERRSVRTADLVLTPNGSFRRLALRRGGVPDNRVLVVRTGPDGVAEAVEQPGRDASHIVFAGVMGDQDGVDLLLRAFAALRDERRRELTLELIGDGPDVPRLRRIASELDLDDSITWAGWLSRDDMRTRLALGSIAVSPDPDSELNRQASMLKIADYLAQGLATVASDLPETRVTCGDAVLYVTPGDVTALADGIERLLDDPELRDKLSKAARQRAARLVWEPSGVRLVQAYRWLVEGGPPLEPEQIP